MVSWKSFASVFGDAQGRILCLEDPKKLQQGCRNRDCSIGSELEEQHKVLSVQPGI